MNSRERLSAWAVQLRGPCTHVRPHTHTLRRASQATAGTAHKGGSTHKAQAPRRGEGSPGGENRRTRGPEVGAGGQQEGEREAASRHSARDSGHSAHVAGCVLEEHSVKRSGVIWPLVGKPSGEHRGKAKRWPELSGLCRG